ELMTAETVFHGLGEHPIKGAAAFRPFYHQFREGFPDLRIAIEYMISEGDCVAARCVVTATHTGPGFLPSPSNRATKFTGMCIGRVRNGKIVEGWNSFDFLSLYRQLGMKLV